MQTRYLRSRGLIVLLLLAASALTAVTAALAPVRGGAVSPAGEAYYMVVYSAQEARNNPITSHCFATFARITKGAPRRVELHHINWFSIRGHQTGTTTGVFEADGQPARAVPGENRTTRDALALENRRGLRISRWGPYEIDRKLYERTLRQIDLLEGRIPGRRVLYKAFDLGLREGADVRALNCIHAISDVDREPAPLRTWTSYGDEAARKVVRHLQRWIKGPLREHADAWGPIWQATWRGTAAPARLGIVRGEVPWRPQTAQAQAIQVREKEG